MKTYRWST